MKDTAYIILNFYFHFQSNKIKLNKTLKFDATDKIKVNTIIINIVEYMTY